MNFFEKIQRYTTENYIDQNFCNRCEHQQISQSIYGDRQVINYATKCGTCFLTLPKYYVSNFSEKKYIDINKEQTDDNTTR